MTNGTVKFTGCGESRGREVCLETVTSARRLQNDRRCRWPCCWKPTQVDTFLLDQLPGSAGRRVHFHRTMATCLLTPRPLSKYISPHYARPIEARRSGPPLSPSLPPPSTPSLAAPPTPLHRVSSSVLVPTRHSCLARPRESWA